MGEPLPTLRPAFGGHAPCRLSHLQLGALFPGLCRTTGISGIPCLELWQCPFFLGQSLYLVNHPHQRGDVSAFQSCSPPAFSLAETLLP